MCGIFGMVRSETATSAARERSALAISILGELAEERGTDAAGLAMVLTRSDKASTPASEHVAAQDTLIDGVRIVKRTQPFHRLPLSGLLADLKAAHVVLGHTRWATQGDASSPKNASPLLAGSLIGTHNGDVTTELLPDAKFRAVAALADTDSEQLYLSLHRARHDRRRMVKVLRAAEGRAALAFMDRARPDRLYLARTALSPLSYAISGDGDLFYASNPNWFRKVETLTSGSVTFHHITLVPEGHLLTVNTATREVEDVRRFTATCREQDLPLINSSVYRNFTREDRATDRTLARHRVAVSKMGGWPQLTLAPVPVRKTRRASDPTVVPLWDESDFLDRPANGVDVETLDALCWAFGDFDHETFDYISSAPTAQVDELMSDLWAEIAAAHAAGETDEAFPLADAMRVAS